MAARIRGAGSPGSGTPNEEQQRLQACVDDLCVGIQAQISLMRRCLGVQSGLPQGFPEVVEVSTQRLLDSVEVCRADLLVAARSLSPSHHIFSKLGETSEFGTAVHDSIVDLDQRDPKLSSKSPKSSNQSGTRRSSDEKAVTQVRSRRISLTEQLDVETAAKQDDEESIGKFVDGVMNPNWPGRLCWDMGVILLVVIDAMVLPFQFAYKDGEDPDAFDNAWTSITTGFFTVDIVLSFFTAYTAGERELGTAPGNLVTTKSRIARNYLRTWFPIDFASTIPWGSFANALSGGQSSSQTAQMAKLTKIVKFVRFLRLMRMLRLAKLAMIWEKVEARMGSVILKQTLALLRVALVLVGICHWNACIWWMIGQPASLITELMSPEAQASFKAMRHWTTVPRGSIGEEWTWLERRRSEQYTFCFYWTLGVMRTMPAEVTPENQPERVYVMVFMFFAFSAFAICVALITQTFFKFSERKRVFDDDMAQVRMYMRNLKEGGASDKLQASVKSFLKHMYDQRKTHAKENTMLQYLPPSLLSQLKYERLNKTLNKLEILQGLPSKAAYHVSDMCEIRDIPPGTHIAIQDRTAEACWLLLSGRLHFSSCDGDLGVTPTDIVDPECLRETKATVSPYTVSAITAAELIRIDKAKFVQTMSQHDEFKHYLDFLEEIDQGIELGSVAVTAHRPEMETMAAIAAIMS